MSQQEDKKPKPGQMDTPASGEKAQHNTPQPGHRKDPNEYDPVGMAGKPAGILLELGEEEASEESKAKGGQKGPVPKDRSGR